MRKYTMIPLVAAGLLIGVLSAATGYNLYQKHFSEETPTPVQASTRYAKDNTEMAVPEEAAEELHSAATESGTIEQTAPDHAATEMAESMEAVIAAEDRLLLAEEDTAVIPPMREAEATIPANHRYVLSLFDGYVAVFSTIREDDGSFEVREVTDTPVSALSQDERSRLTVGIKIFNDEQLARILQDYGS